MAPQIKNQNALPEAWALSCQIKRTTQPQELSVLRHAHLDVQATFPLHSSIHRVGIVWVQPDPLQLADGLVRATHEESVLLQVVDIDEQPVR